MPTPEDFDSTLGDLIDRFSKMDIASDDATTAVRNLETFSRLRPPELLSEPIPEPVPTTFWGKVKASASCLWDNETTRVLIKAGGAFASVALVAYSTIHRDHVLERQSLAQANQRQS